MYRARITASRGRQAPFSSYGREGSSRRWGRAPRTKLVEVPLPADADAKLEHEVGVAGDRYRSESEHQVNCELRGAGSGSEQRGTGDHRGGELAHQVSGQRRR